MKLKKKTKKRIARVVAVIMCIMMLVPIITYFLPGSSAADSQLLTMKELAENQKVLKGPYEVVGVQTGDRIHIAVKNNSFVYVDLLGIEAPDIDSADGELEKNAGEQSYKNARRLIEGHAVYLEYDGEITNKTESVKSLVYLDDGTLLNEKMLLDGFARTSPALPDAQKESFLAAQDEAKRTEAGLWGSFWKN